LIDYRDSNLGTSYLNLSKRVLVACGLTILTTTAGFGLFLEDCGRLSASLATVRSTHSGFDVGFGVCHCSLLKEDVFTQSQVHPISCRFLVVLLLGWFVPLFVDAKTIADLLSLTVFTAFGLLVFPMRA
jgi:hypothetical protein